jgi:uncharacterized membrane protein (DUF2068 family)
MEPSDDRLMRAIALFKLFKAVLLILLAVGAFRLLHRNLADVLAHGIGVLNLDPSNRFVDAALGKATKLGPDQIKKIGLGSFIYAGLFLTEGTGLWLRKRWAEWFTVIITSSLVPVELYEIQRHPTAVKVAVLALNVGIVGYLVFRIRFHSRERAT